MNMTSLFKGLKIQNEGTDVDKGLKDLLVSVLNIYSFNDLTKQLA